MKDSNYYQLYLRKSRWRWAGVFRYSSLSRKIVALLAKWRRTIAKWCRFFVFSTLPNSHFLRIQTIKFFFGKFWTYSSNKCNNNSFSISTWNIVLLIIRTSQAQSVLIPHPRLKKLLLLYWICLRQVVGSNLHGLSS